MNKIRILIVLLCIFQNSLIFCTEPTLPNIVIFLADDLGYADLSCYDSENTRTPNVDKLAREGVKFTDFYAASPVCSPSRAALLTGRNPNRVGIYSWVPDNSPMHLRLSEITIPELLRSKGYATAHFGKWHLAMWCPECEDDSLKLRPTPADHGFDYWFGCDNNAIPSHNNPTNYMRNGISVGQLNGYACQLVADETIDWLNDHWDGVRPFFLNVWFNEPHEKVAAPPKYSEKHLKNGMNEHDAHYYGSIENMDEAVGRILKYLDDIGVSDETLIIFTSDNGSKLKGSNGVLKGYKSQIWEGGVRVPAIIRWKNRVDENFICTTPVCLADLLPSICEITGINTPDLELDGQSLWPFLKNDHTGREKPIYIFYHRFGDAMFRINEWCLIGHLGEESTGKNWFGKTQMNYILNNEPESFELYNLDNDLQQTTDVKTQNRKVTNKLKRKMVGLYRETIKEGGDWYKKRASNK